MKFLFEWIIMDFVKHFRAQKSLKNQSAKSQLLNCEFEDSVRNSVLQPVIANIKLGTGTSKLTWAQHQKLIFLYKCVNAVTKILKKLPSRINLCLIHNVKKFLFWKWRTAIMFGGICLWKPLFKGIVSQHTSWNTLLSFWIAKKPMSQ